MNEHTLKPSELQYLLHHNGIKNYKWKGFLRGGNSPKFLLENIINKQEVIGKVVLSPSEGELKIWPKLQHHNVNRFLEAVTLDKNVKMLLSPVVGKCIADLIHENSFNEHLLCFDRKKSYAKDILSGLNYLHENSVFLLNLNDANVSVCPSTNTAVICDFSNAVVGEKVAKKSLPANGHYMPPEVQKASDSEIFCCSAIDMWNYGILFLQVFTQHLLPWRGVVSDSLEFLGIHILTKANVGSNLDKKVVSALKIFIQKLLSQNPASRPSAEEAFEFDFLHMSSDCLDEKARNFWESDEICSSLNDSSRISVANSTMNSTSEISLSQDNSSLSSKEAAFGENEYLKHHPSSYMFNFELDTKMHEEILKSVLEESSFTSLPHKSKSGSSLWSEDTNVTDNTREQSNRNSRHNKARKEYHKRNPYDVFLTEWEADLLTNLGRLNFRSSQTDSENEDDLSKNLPEPTLKPAYSQVISPDYSPRSNRYSTCIKNEEQNLESTGYDLADKSQTSSQRACRTSDPNIHKVELENETFAVKETFFGLPLDTEISTEARVSDIFKNLPPDANNSAILPSTESSSKQENFPASDENNILNHVLLSTSETTDESTGKDIPITVFEDGRNQAKKCISKIVLTAPEVRDENSKITPAPIPKETENLKHLQFANSEKLYSKSKVLDDQNCSQELSQNRRKWYQNLCCGCKRNRRKLKK